MKKRVLSVLLTAMTIVSLTACGISGSLSTNSTESAADTGATAAVEDDGLTFSVKISSDRFSSISYLFGRFAMVKGENGYYVIDMSSDDYSAETGNVLGKTFYFKMRPLTANMFIGVEQNPDNPEFYTSTVYSYDESTATITEVLSFDGTTRSEAGWYIDDYDPDYGYVQLEKCDSEWNITQVAFADKDFTQFAYSDVDSASGGLVFMNSGIRYENTSDSVTKSEDIADYLNDGGEGSYSLHASDSSYSESYYLDLYSEFNSRDCTLADAYDEDGNWLYIGLYNGVFFYPCTEEQSGAGITSENMRNKKTAMQEYLELVTSEIGEGDDAVSLYRVYDPINKVYLTDEEYKVLKPCLNTDYANGGAICYLVRYTDDTYGYLDSDFNDMGVKYDDATFLSDLYAGWVYQLAIVQSNGTWMAIVNGTTPVENYVLSDGTTSTEFPISKFSEAYILGCDNSTGAVYFGIEYADDTSLIMEMSK